MLTHKQARESLGKGRETMCMCGYNGSVKSEYGHRNAGNCPVWPSFKENKFTAAHGPRNKLGGRLAWVPPVTKIVFDLDKSEWQRTAFRRFPEQLTG